MESTSLTLSLIPLIVSCIALIVALWHNIKSYTPLIRIKQTTSDLNGHISISIINKGVGPAIIQRLEFIYQDKILGRNFNKITHILETSGVWCRSYWQTFGPGSVLPPGEEFIPIRLEFGNGPLREEVIDFIDSISIRIWYKSIYGITYHLYADRTCDSMSFEKIIFSPS